MPDIAILPMNDEKNWTVWIWNRYFSETLNYLKLNFISFFSGEDPLLDISDGKDINSVAGVLKLYFRELKKPLFPVQLFDELMACTSEYLLSGTYFTDFFFFF